MLEFFNHVMYYIDIKVKPFMQQNDDEEIRLARLQLISIAIWLLFCAIVDFFSDELYIFFHTYF